MLIFNFGIKIKLLFCKSLEFLVAFKVKFSSIKKEGISFDIHNLMDGPYNSGFDIVYCRNVLLHMTIKGKKKALSSLKDGVKEGGILILGDTDPHIFEDNWERKKYNNVIFWKKKW